MKTANALTTGELFLLGVYEEADSLPTFNHANLRNNDYAVIITAVQPGIIFFGRNKNPLAGKIKNVFDGTPFMTYRLPKSCTPARAEALLKKLGRGFSVEKTSGEEMDGMIIPFFTLHKEGKF